MQSSQKLKEESHISFTQYDMYTKGKIIGTQIKSARQEPIVF